MIRMKESLMIGLFLLSLNACTKDQIDRFSVVYEVEFVSTWSASSHPTDFPSGAHFSPFVAVSHLSSSRLFIEGLSASEGLRNVAETGNTDKINEELEFFVNTGEGLDVIQGNRFDSPGNSSKIQLGLREGYHYVTAVSMIAPSPDWFVSATTSLQDQTDGLWYDEVTSYVISYDAGSDDGTSFSSANSPLDSIEPVTYLSEGPLTEGLDSVVNMGYFKFTRIK
ncbi:MAG: hypothetical protein ACI9O4_001163 [Chitinophagales bacterium]|jgi:hypothetical protein